MALQEGDKAPDFDMETDQGTVSLSQYRGGKLVLYFYPKDSTPGCTKEAEGFTAQRTAFVGAKATIIGVSRDSAKAHANFRAKYDLAITLGSDANGRVTQDYGVWVEKKNYGRIYMGIERSTFLIDADGKIAKIWRKVKVAGHVEEVLNAAKAL